MIRVGSQRHRKKRRGRYVTHFPHSTKNYVSKLWQLTYIYKNQEKREL